MPHIKTSDGVSLYYEETGIGAAIVFVHDNSADPRTDAGSDASDPENAVPFSLKTPAGKTYKQPGNFNYLIETAAFGTDPKFAARGVKPDDLLVVFFAGHGDATPGKPPAGLGSFVFCCPDYSPQKPGETAVSAEEMFDALARKIVRQRRASSMSSRRVCQ